MADVKTSCQQEFEKALTKLINVHCIDNILDTPDYILSAYVVKALEAYGFAKKRTAEFFDLSTWVNMDDKTPVLEEKVESLT